MKTTYRYLGILFLFALSVNLSAQTKIGHINSQELMMSLPETDSAQKQLEEFAGEHELLLESLSVEYNKKLVEFEEKFNQLSPLAKETYQAELQDFQTRIQGTRQRAEQEIQQKEAELLQPIQQKVMTAINEVAEENGYTYIINTQFFLYIAEDAKDILPLVKTKLGIE